MREILFRGKTENGEWYYGYYAKLRNCRNEIYSAIICKDEETEEGYMEDLHSVIPETVGQYTGLKFKGVKAFVGDIVKGLFLHGSAILGIVDFQDGAFGLAWKRGKINEFSPFPCMCNVDYEIVGNIHDNPELLGE